MYQAFPPLKPDAWPEIDRRLWAAACEPADFLDEEGPASSWAPSTLGKIEYDYGVWLGWLERTGQLDPAALPQRRVDRDRVRHFIALYAPGRAEGTVASVAHNIAAFVRCAAPPDGLDWLNTLAFRMRKRAKPARSKSPRMSSVRELLTLGLDLFSEGAGMMADGDGLPGAVQMRDGLIILMLVARPIRRRNLCGMRLGETVFVTERQVRADFPPSQTKAGNRIAFSYPSWLRPLIDAYLTDARPILRKNPHSSGVEDGGWFWLTRKGTPLDPVYATTRFPRLIAARTGRATSLHLFRHCAATEIALRDPEHVGIVKDVLQHCSMKSGQAYYIQARMAAALDDWADVIAEIRKEAV
jgi:integrase